MNDNGNKLIKAYFSGEISRENWLMVKKLRAENKDFAKEFEEYSDFIFNQTLTELSVENPHHISNSKPNTNHSFWVYTGSIAAGIILICSFLWFNLKKSNHTELVLGLGKNQQELFNLRLPVLKFEDGSNLSSQDSINIIVLRDNIPAVRYTFQHQTIYILSAEEIDNPLNISVYESPNGTGKMLKWDGTFYHISPSQLEKPLTTIDTTQIYHLPK